MHYTITQKSLEQLRQEGSNVTLLCISNGIGKIPARFIAHGRTYREAYENMIKGYESTLRDFRRSLPEERDIEFGICEQESKVLRDEKNNEVVIIIGRMMALIG